ncbi:hypothetical protein KC19_VG273300 [Ceratodon purpureus]|uniref:Uncharacterized protein n=1 Tax=Ceratodon purpureus TaxID=3225 RepID=A0A8T0HVV7_CERPU|nr:hypothetical protein KC19_VG273300 [Ceratodon purpureus]
MPRLWTLFRLLPSFKQHHHKVRHQRPQFTTKAVKKIAWTSPTISPILISVHNRSHAQLPLSKSVQASLQPFISIFQMQMQVQDSSTLHKPQSQ